MSTDLGRRRQEAAELTAAADVSTVDHRNRLVLAFLLALVPLAFLGISFGGLQLTGWAWLMGLLVTTPIALRQRVHPAVMRRLTPYLAFLAVATFSLAWAPVPSYGLATVVQLVVPVPAFLVAARVVEPERALRGASVAAAVGIAVAAFLTAVELFVSLPASAPLSPRPMSIALVVLFVVATVHAGRRRTLVLAVTVLAIAVVTGSRTASAVLLVVIMLSPAWRLQWRGRVALGLAGLAAVAAFSTTATFQERFFFSKQGSIGDALGGSSQLNTAGRRELWPQLSTECGLRSVTGYGPGSATLLTEEITLGALLQPHNDYLRTWCDTGLVGAVPFWGFFVLVAARGLSLARRGHRLGAAAGQLVVALLLLALTDNPIIYTAHFMVPLAVLAGLACATELKDEQA